MWEFEKDIVKKAFKNFWGLQDALKAAVNTNDKMLLDGAIDSLKTYTGMNEDFLKKHIDEIITL